MKNKKNKENRADDYNAMLENLQAETGSASSSGTSSDSDIMVDDATGLYNNLGNNYAGAGEHNRNKSARRP